MPTSTAGIGGVEEVGRQLGESVASQLVRNNFHLASADLTKWIAYFKEGMATAFEKVRDQALREAERGGKDQSKQRRALALFRKAREIAAKDVADLFGYRPRTAALLCQRWVEKGFLETTDPAKKSRRYRLHDTYESIVDEID